MKIAYAQSARVWHGAADVQCSSMRIVDGHHVAISTSNFAALREFYVETLGLPVVGGFPGHDILFLGAGSIAIELIGETTPPSDRVHRAGWHHFAWVVDDVDASYAELSGIGVPFRTPPENFPCEAPTMRIAFFQDPDGNLLELVQPFSGRDSSAREVLTA